jgi:hypothetical protein
MKLVTYQTTSHGNRLGAVLTDKVTQVAYILDVQASYQEMLKHRGDSSNVLPPSSMADLLMGGSMIMEMVRKWHDFMVEQTIVPLSAIAQTLDNVVLCAPLPNPTTIRDGYAFRQHVETARRNRGV